jgi:hypothetical protein
MKDLIANWLHSVPYTRISTTVTDMGTVLEANLEVVYLWSTTSMHTLRS